MNPSVQEKVNMPGLALAATGGIGLVFALLNGALALFGIVTSILAATSSGDATGYLVASAPGLIINIVLMITMFIGPVLALLGGLRLKNATSPNLVMAGAIAAMIPCCNPCCLIGIATGAWAILTMQDDEVRAAMADA